MIIGGLFVLVIVRCYNMKCRDIIVYLIVLISMEESILGAEFTMSVLQGEQALLPCILPSYIDDNVTVTWYYWQQEISVGENVTTDDDRFTLYRPYKQDWYLRLSNTQLRDVGRYKCTADESFSSITTLVVESPPKIVGYNTDKVFIQICYKARLTLYCNVTGLPRPTIKWYKLDDRNAPISILSDKELYEQRVFIPEVDETSPGIYMCKVTNTHGETSMTFHVTVIDLMTIIEPVRKSDVPSQIVYAPVLTNAQESSLSVPYKTLCFYLSMLITLLFIYSIH